MSTLLTLIVIWIIASVPISLIAGRFLAIRDQHHYGDLIAPTMFEGDIVN